MPQNKYSTMSNRELLELAKKQDVSVSNTEKLLMTSFRGVLMDTQGDGAREAVIKKLEARDEASRSQYALRVALVAAVLAVVAIIVSLIIWFFPR